MDSHAHHAIQIVVKLAGWFRISTDHQSLEGDVVAVPADVAHSLEAEGLVGFLYIEPESRVGRAVAQNIFRSGISIAVPDITTSDVGDAIIQAYHSADRDALGALGNKLVLRLAGTTQAHVPDLRIRKVLAWAGLRLDKASSLAAAAEVCGLSSERLRHLFVEQTGLPFRTYLLWLRLSRGVALLASGASPTEAAHDAGFADAAHFSRTFRRMYGIAPTNLRIT